MSGGVQAQLGDAYGGETRRVVFALHVGSLPTLGPTTIGEVVLRYVSIGEQIEQHETRIPLNVNLVSADEAAAAGLDTEVSEEVVILRSARAQRDAHGRVQLGDYEGAKSVLREAADELRSHATGSPNADELRRLAADIEEDLPFLEDGEFDASSSKRLHYKQNLSSQRRLQMQPEEEERRKGGALSQGRVSYPATKVGRWTRDGCDRSPSSRRSFATNAQRNLRTSMRSIPRPG